MTVALIGALDCLTPGRLTPHEVAYAAHAVEVEMLKQQSGIQDQLCSAYGGINFIEMFEYPYASVSPIYVPNASGGSWSDAWCWSSWADRTRLVGGAREGDRRAGGRGP